MWLRYLYVHILYVNVSLYFFVLIRHSFRLMHISVFSPMHYHLPDLEYPVRKRRQCDDLFGPKLSTIANKVKPMIISEPSILLSVACLCPNPVHLYHNAVITICKLLHSIQGTTHLFSFQLDATLSFASHIRTEPYLMLVPL